MKQAFTRFKAKRKISKECRRIQELLINELENKKESIACQLDELAVQLEQMESGINSLPEIFITEDGKLFGKNILRLHGFADSTIQRSVWGSKDFVSAFLGAFGERYALQIHRQNGVDLEEARKIAEFEQKRAESMTTLLGSQEIEVEWNGFVLLTLTIGIYTYCGVLINSLRTQLLNSEMRCRLLLKGSNHDFNTENLQHDVEKLIRIDPYHRMTAILRGFKINNIIREIMEERGLAQYQEDFYALKKARDHGAHVDPLLDFDDFETGNLRRRIREFSEDIQRGDEARRSMDDNRIAQSIQDVEKETGNLDEETKKELEEHLRSGEDNDITKAILGHITDQMDTQILLSRCPVMGAVYPAIFERCIIALSEILDEIDI